MRKYNVIETVKRSGKYVATGAVALGAAALPAISQAAVDVAVTDAMAGTQADQATIGGLILISAVTAFGFRWLKAQFF